MPDFFLENGKDRTQNSIFLAPTDPQEILGIINRLHNKKSYGVDGISTSLLKVLKNEIIEPISKLINKSLSEGKFPNNLKISKIIPIYKSKSRECVDNYRPISILPSVSKIYEKVVFKRVYAFLDQHNIIYESQYGFRPKHSTIDAITEFGQKACNTLENKIFLYGCIPGPVQGL